MTPYTDRAFRYRGNGSIISKVVGVTHQPGYPGFCHILMEASRNAFLNPGLLDETDDPDGSKAVIHHAIYHPQAEELAGVLILDRSNPHDANAVEVHVPMLECRVGFLPAKLAADVSMVLRLGLGRFTVSVWAVENLVKPEYPGVRCLLTPVDMS